MKIFNKVIYAFLLLFAAAGLQAQNEPEYVKWTYTAECGEKPNEVVVKIHADILEPWHLYDVVRLEAEFPPNETKVVIPEAEEGESWGYKLKGSTTSPTKLHEEYEPALDMVAKYFTGEADFVQVFKLERDVEEITFQIDYQVCTESQCAYPWPINCVVKVPKGCFSNNATNNLGLDQTVQIKPEDGLETTSGSATETNDNQDQATDASGTNENAPGESAETAKADEASATTVTDCGTVDPWEDSEETKGMWKKMQPSDEDESLWMLFIICFGAGLLALLTPCVFPMIPMTVNFFIKQSGNKRKGVFNALLYGLCIIVIYTGLGFILTLLFGEDVMNEMASNGYVNFAFFAIFLLFGFSFLGAFEITLPSWLVNKSDQQADKGGLIGIFFMAFTLAVVSFSCTGPIIGNLLVAAAGENAVLGPIIGMFGFSLALAIPFMLFAVFPSWLANMPKSGGWLNSVKVVLGLAELALALKFLSNVDLAYHWGILTREIFVASWIVISLLIGLYLIGKLKFSHDSDLPFISVPRIFLAILFFTFSVYMLPGMFGAPLQLLSGLAPPKTHVEDVNWMRRGQVGIGDINPEVLDPNAECPNGIPCTKDYVKAMRYACENNMPVLVDFTGYTCVNCRKMEENVWPDASIDDIFRNEVVVASLYVDDKSKLPKDEYKTKNIDGQEVTLKQVGYKWKHMQSHRAGTASQPYYVLIGPDEKLLNDPIAYEPDVEEYTKWLREGLEVFEKRYK